MAGKPRRRSIAERITRSAALTLTGASAGLAAAFATGAWWVRTAAAAAGGTAALAAAIWDDHASQRRAAQQARGQILDPVISGAEQDSSVFGVLLATRAIAPFQGRTADLARLTKWCDNPHGHPVAVITGPAGTGKTRLATHFASQRPTTWATGWLRPGRGTTALPTIRPCGDPALILIDDADQQPDLTPLLEDLATHPNSPSSSSWCTCRTAIRPRSCATR
jgi:hypothetical protein